MIPEQLNDDQVLLMFARIAASAVDLEKARRVNRWVGADKEKAQQSSRETGTKKEVES